MLLISKRVRNSTSVGSGRAHAAVLRAIRPNAALKQHFLDGSPTDKPVTEPWQRAHGPPSEVVETAAARGCRPCDYFR
jgi:hypothetical protein